MALRGKVIWQSLPTVAVDRDPERNSPGLIVVPGPALQPWGLSGKYIPVYLSGRHVKPPMRQKWPRHPLAQTALNNVRRYMPI